MRSPFIHYLPTRRPRAVFRGLLRDTAEIEAYDYFLGDSVGTWVWIGQAGTVYTEDDAGNWSLYDASGFQAWGSAAGDYCDTTGFCSGNWTSDAPAKVQAVKRAATAKKAATPKTPANTAPAATPAPAPAAPGQPPAGAGFFNSAASSLGVAKGTAEAIVIGGGIVVLFLLTRKK